MAKRFEIRSIFMILLVSIGLLSIGCSQQPAPPTTETPPIPGYQGLQEEFGPKDFSPLRGRLIVLDPGHGGFFRGALGPNGLTEAEVNLGVALYLRGLLEWAGANVHLTRSADYDFLTPADSTLTSDLAFRSSFTDSLQPDVFISIHHNSTASRDPDVNETQTYYPLGDEGASVDLARSVHRHLVLNLEITPAKILPGNFHVLRQATVPAILGEPSMISNPVMEGRLSLAASQELEAKAYFLGLLDYFALGQPRWSGAATDTLQWESGNPTMDISWVFQSSRPSEDPGPGPRPSSYRLTLDGQDQGFDLSADGRSVTWRTTSTLTPGEHLLHLRGQNLKGRATPDRFTLLQVSTGPRLTVNLTNETQTTDTPSQTMIHWQSVGKHSTHAGFLDVSSHLSLPIPSTTQGWFLLPTSDLDPDRLQFRLPQNQSNSPLHPNTNADLPPGVFWRLITTGEKPEYASSWIPYLGWRHRMPDSPGTMPPGSGSTGPAIIWQPGQPVWIEGRGVLPLVDSGQGPDDRPRTVISESNLWHPRMLLPQLQGRTIVLDPAGGGTNNDGTYLLGTRGADINLATARQAQNLLEGAGAHVLLTRSGEVAPDAQQKVLLAGNAQADLFLTIGRTTDGGLHQALHHPGSQVGIKWAQAMSSAMAPLDSLTIGQSYAYLLRHTACPALEVRLQAPQTAPEELQISSLPWQMAEARAILLACAAALSADGNLPQNRDPAQLIGRLPGGLSLPGIDWAVWDGNFSWQPPTSLKPGHAVTSWTTPGWPTGPGVHTLEVHASSQWQMWRVEILPSGLDFQLMMENR